MEKPRDPEVLQKSKTKTTGFHFFNIILVHTSLTSLIKELSIINRFCDEISTSKTMLQIFFHDRVSKTMLNNQDADWSFNVCSIRHIH